MTTYSFSSSQICLCWPANTSVLARFNNQLLLTAFFHLKLIHTAPCQIRQNYLVSVASASAVWIGFPTTQDCRRQKIWSKLNTFSAIVQFTPAHQTRHREDRLVLSGGRCELGIMCRRVDLSATGMSATWPATASATARASSDCCARC